MNELYRCCCVCCEEFRLIDRFEIVPGDRTGILCKPVNGHPLCNMCFVRIYRHECPVCKEDIGGEKFQFPTEISHQMRIVDEGDDLGLTNMTLSLLLANQLFISLHDDDDDDDDDDDG